MRLRTPRVAATEFSIMQRSTYTAVMAATALCLSFASPAAAQGKAERARIAIAEAQTKIDTAEALGTSTAQPGQTAAANAALARAKENLAAGHKPEAIEDAIRASALADTALGLMQKNAKLRSEAVQSQVRAQTDGMARAQMSVDAARQQTDMANDRAMRAENSAAASASDAAVARNAAMAAQPTVVETTVTTQEAAPPVVVRKVVKAKAKRPNRRVVHHRRVVHRAIPAKVTTTTTVTQTNP
jgi:hypothetical protein